ncbi:Peptidyl-tRNA hydrolase [Poriferisphaera corsica]|uniref:Peptidyl-tRNA hydrolase n=1 Tax=Poriferisphaera corsica TaxID=2528020 RepID=A0A517YTS8_9BACT|nr:aminoacyl-tRNA hydrolase [Poriferisphaera corsica]QDU33634.1 Peptidyl-tRNA hydrolase [Poriferisphaera corsica]
MRKILRMLNWWAKPSILESSGDVQQDSIEENCIAMKLIVGIGNPGKEYEKTRHNAGFMAIDRLAERNCLSSDKTKFHAHFIEGVIAGKKTLLMKPMTFMNRSGLAVGEAVRFYKIEPKDVLVLVDDIALPCGRIRLRSDGSAGGHNGLTDIKRVLGTQTYPRLRIGIDAPGRVPQKDYVLGRFSPDQEFQVERAINRAAEAIEHWIREDDMAQTMTIYNKAAEEE